MLPGDRLACEQAFGRAGFFSPNREPVHRLVIGKMKRTNRNPTLIYAILKNVLSDRLIHFTNCGGFCLVRVLGFRGGMRVTLSF